MIQIEWEGFDEVKRAFDDWAEDVIKELTVAMDENGDDLLQKSQALAPKLTGDLEGSGTKGDVLVSPISKEISVAVGFHKTYAARRHEENSNPGSITSGKPGVDGMKAGTKYLERPLQRYTPKYMQNLADAVRRTTGGS